jgi:hypothetical protein
MRLIDADELKKQILISCLYLAETGDITDKNIANLFAEAFVKIIDKAPSVPHNYDCNHDCDALKEITQKWIPCSERLPEENGRYLVTRGLKACDSLWNRVYIVNYSDLMGLKKRKIWWSGNVGKSDFEKYDNVIAWQPLPEPYREERTEE